MAILSVIENQPKLNVVPKNLNKKKQHIIPQMTFQGLAVNINATPGYEPMPSVPRCPNSSASTDRAIEGFDR